jgi:hypothetical protein
MLYNEIFNRCATRLRLRCRLRVIRLITIKFVLQLPLCYAFVRIVSDRLETNIP